jgi:hypothetical protein
VELLDNKRLVGQIKSLERRTRGSGKDLVDCFYPGSHDDLINAGAGALVLAGEKRITRRGRVYIPGAVSLAGSLAGPAAGESKAELKPGEIQPEPAAILTEPKAFKRRVFVPAGRGGKSAGDGFLEAAFDTIKRKGKDE